MYLSYVKTEVSDLEGWMQNCQSQGIVSLKATNSLFVRLLLIAKSSREINLEDLVHEFASSNATLMKPDSSLLPSTNKSILIHKLKHMAATSISQTGEELINQPMQPDKYGMALIGDSCLQKSNQNL